MAPTPIPPPSRRSVGHLCYHHAGYGPVYDANGDEIGWAYQGIPLGTLPTNRYPGGFKLAIYNRCDINTALDSLPPGCDFGVTHCNGF